MRAVIHSWSPVPYWWDKAKMMMMMMTARSLVENLAQSVRCILLLLQWEKNKGVLSKKGRSNFLLKAQFLNSWPKWDYHACDIIGKGDGGDRNNNIRNFLVVWWLKWGHLCYKVGGLLSSDDKDNFRKEKITQDDFRIWFPVILLIPGSESQLLFASPGILELKHLAGSLSYSQC